MIRYNSSLQIYEGYSTKHNQWESLQNVRDGDRDTYITAENVADDDHIRFFTQGIERMSIANDLAGGLVGIGITQDPIYVFEIRDDRAMLIPVGGYSTRPTPPEEGLIRFNTERQVYEGYGTNEQWNVLQDPISDNDGDTYIRVELFNDEDRIRFATSGTQRMVIEPNTGYIGINISTPTCMLDIDGDVCITGDLEIGTDVVIGGNLTVSGTTITNNVEELLVEDPLIKLATNNGGDTLDIGFYALYDGLGVTKFTGLVRDASNVGYYTLFEGLTEDPATNEVNFADVGITRADLRVDIIDANFVDFPGDELRIRTTAGSADKVIITPTPYLGVNIYPQYPLHVVTANPMGWSARFQNTSDLFLANSEGQGIMLNTNVTSGSGNYAVCFKNTTFGSAAPLFQVNNDGKVGIHTASPTNLVQIVTTTAGEGIDVGNAFIGIYDGSTAYMSIGNDDGGLTHTTDYALRQGTSGDTYINAATNQDIILTHNNSTTITDQVVVDTSGNLGIGTDPTQSLE